MTNSKYVPKRRFKEFESDGEWIIRKLTDFIELFSGLTYSPNDVRKSGTLVLRSSNIKNGEIVEADNVFVSPAKATSENVKPGDIIVVVRNGSRSLIGKHARVKCEKPNTVIGAFMAGIHTEHSLFVNALLDTPKFGEEIEKNMGATINQITGPMFSEMEFIIPDELEQDIIGNFFQTIDSLLSLHKHKLDKLKNLKKAYLSEMFPAEGERVPKRRFPGFEGEWEQMRLGDIAERFDNLRVPVASKDRVSGTIPYYGANGIQDYVDGFTHNGEFVLLAEDGANDLKNYPVHYVKGKIWVNNHAHVIQGKEDLIDNRFLLFAVKQIQIEPYLVGGGRAKLNADIMMDLPLIIPEISEQKSIGSFLMTLDKRITLQQQKIDKLNDLKKAYLNELFV